MTKLKVTAASDSPVVVQVEKAPQNAHRPMADIIAASFHIRTVAHVNHLTTRSFAAHAALNEFYIKVVELADDLAEAYQGEFGLIEELPEALISLEISMLNEQGGLLLSLEKYVALVTDRRAFVSGSSYLQNIIDTLMELTRKTQYKLKYLA